MKRAMVAAVLAGALSWSNPAGAVVVVEDVGDGSALAEAGIRAGDILVSWEEGEIRSVFDWFWLKAERAPRGPLELVGERKGEREVFEVKWGPWAAEVRPRLPPAMLADYSRGRGLVTAGRTMPGIEVWRSLVKVLNTEDDEVSACWLLLRIAETWAEVGEPAKAEAAYKAALDATGGAEARLAVAVSLNESGRAAFERRDLESAEAFSQHALKVHESPARASFTMAESLNLLGTIARHRGELSLAKATFQRALTLRESLAPSGVDAAASLNNLGLVAWQEGDLRLASDYLQRALKIWEKRLPGSLAIANCLNNLGNVARAQGEIDWAEDHYRHSLDIRNEQVPGSLDVALSLNNLGAVAWHRGDLDTTQDYFQRALEIRERLAPGSLDVTESLNNLGALAWRRGQWDLSRSYLERALEIQEKQAPESLIVALVLHNLGELTSDSQQFDLAEGYFHRALKIREKLAPGSQELALTRYRLGIVSRNKGQLDLASRRFESAIEALESQITKLGGSQDVKGDFRGEYRHFYQDALEIHLRLNRPEDAFMTLERYRARSFLALLAERDLYFSVDISPDRERARRDLSTRYDKTLNRLMSLRSIEDQEKVEALTSDLRRLQREREVINNEILESSPRFAALQDPRPLDHAGARSVLDPGTVMLSYSVGRDRGHIFVVTRNRALEVAVLEIGEQELQDKVRLFRELLPEAIPGSSIGAFRANDLTRLGEELYELLIGPVVEAVAVGERVLVIPDGSLHLLPFGALTRDGRYLVEWKPLHFALSATVYGELKASRRETDPPASAVQLSAFGDPRYPVASLEQTREAFTDPQVRSALERGLFDWQPLPYSRREIERIVRLYPSGVSRVYLSEDATEERVSAVGSESRILHFAVHSYLDDLFPLNSALALAIPEDLGGGRANGLLQVWEIFERLRLDADLVVLSSCESGLGEEQGGEGLIGLTRAFQYAGARTVAATLWKVDDRVTAELMVRFYRHLKAGLTKDAALRAAQIELIRRPLRVEEPAGEAVEIDASTPYYWAAFQLYGDWR